MTTWFLWLFKMIFYNCGVQCYLLLLPRGLLTPPHLGDLSGVTGAGVTATMRVGTRRNPDPDTWTWPTVNHQTIFQWVLRMLGARNYSFVPKASKHSTFNWFVFKSALLFVLICSVKTNTIWRAKAHQSKLLNQKKQSMAGYPGWKVLSHITSSQKRIWHALVRLIRQHWVCLIV